MAERIHLQPAVKVLAGPFQPDPRCEVASITYANGRLAVRVEATTTNAEVVFTFVRGFRVLDEIDLQDFWSQCSLETGWLFEVTDGGWKALELQHGQFVSGEIYKDLREYLVVGLNECVSVLSTDQPWL